MPHQPELALPRLAALKLLSRLNKPAFDATLYGGRIGRDLRRAGAASCARPPRRAGAISREQATCLFRGGHWRAEGMAQKTGDAAGKSSVGETTLRRGYAKIRTNRHTVAA